MKDMLTRKKRHKDKETTLLDANCSSILKQALPVKEFDPGSVTLLVAIGDTFKGNGLIDLGASINLIPLSIVKRLGNVRMESTRMALQLADKSTISLYGVVKDMVVKVDKYLFPVDFVVIDMKEDREIPLILGRPFMKTPRMIIDVDNEMMKVRVQDKEVGRASCSER